MCTCVCVYMHMCVYVCVCMRVRVGAGKIGGAGLQRAQCRQGCDPEGVTFHSMLRTWKLSTR